MFNYLRDFRLRYGKAPGLTAIKNDHPGWQMESVSEPLEYVIDKFAGYCKARKARTLLFHLAAALDDPDPSRRENIDSEFLEAARELAADIPSAGIHQFSDMQARLEQYEHEKETGRTKRVMWGFKSLDEATDGLQPHEIAVVSGFTGSGKSTMLMQLTRNAYTMGNKILYISLEMEAGTILRRLDSMESPFSYGHLKKLSLTQDELSRYRDRSLSMEHADKDIIVVDSIRNCTPDHVYAETVKHKPDLVVVDYVSLMRSGQAHHKGAKNWEVLSDITRELKQNARILKVPIIAAAQTNRSGAKEGAEMDNIAYSQSIIQDADIMIGLHADQEMKDANERHIRLRKNRDGPLAEFYARWDYKNMDFREKRMMET
jgi:replicative DNA helicase